MLFQIPCFHFVKETQRTQVDAADRDPAVSKLVGQFENRSVATEDHGNIDIIKECHPGTQMCGIDMMIKILCTLCHVGRQKIRQIMVFTQSDEFAYYMSAFFFDQIRKNTDTHRITYIS